MQVYRGYKTELRLNNRQRTLMARYADTARWVFNWGLERRLKVYEETGQLLRYIQQSAELTQLRRQPEYAWLRQVSATTQQMALQYLEAGYEKFFTSLGTDTPHAIPKFKSRKTAKRSFGIRGRFMVYDKAVKVPSFGLLRLKERGYLPKTGARVFSATISEKNGRWFIALRCLVETPDQPAASGPVVGIDLGVKTLATLSDGRTFKNIRARERHQKKMRRLQRKYARGRKDSVRHEKLRLRIAKLHAHIAAVRLNHLHMVTSMICARTKPSHERPRVVVMEDLNVTGILKNRRLARVVADAGFGEFFRQMEYKTAALNEGFLAADQFYASSKACHVCGTVNAQLKLKEREWTCTCGVHHDRDHNAALNLAALADMASPAKIYVRGEKVRPVVYGTTRRSGNWTLNPVARARISS